MGKECQTCGNIISDDYYRVIYPEGAPVEFCPRCEDRNSTNFSEKEVAEEYALGH